jgi:hypothetical protein
MLFRKKPAQPPQPPLTNNGLETLKPDKTDIIALIIAGFQVIMPFVLFLLAGVVITAVLMMTIWK